MTSASRVVLALVPTVLSQNTQAFMPVKHAVAGVNIAIQKQDGNFPICHRQRTRRVLIHVDNVQELFQ
ncbi:MAG: hypothetical protein NVSMB6_10800 [Burkholderiaceae bacterium]